MNIHQVKNKILRIVALPLLAGALYGLPCKATQAGQVDITTFNTLRVGMAESEVITRAGYPDLDTSIGALVGPNTQHLSYADGLTRTYAGHSYQLEKEFHYIPSSSEHDPHLTIVKIRGGRVAAITRTKVFSRSNLPAESTRTGNKILSDHEIKVLRAERTVRAAQQYAQTRANLKADAEQSAPSEEPTAIYSSKQADGSTYFGDRPPTP